MSINVPQFPDQIWDGTTPSRDFRSDNRQADAEDWDQIVAEMIATQKIVITGRTILVPNGFGATVAGISAYIRADGTAFLLTPMEQESLEILLVCCPNRRYQDNLY